MLHGGGCARLVALFVANEYVSRRKNESYLWRGGGPTRQRNKLETHFFTLAEALLAYHTVAYDRYGTQVAVLAPAGCLYDTILQFYELPVCTDYVL
jgi:hypothetical protein